MDKDTKPFRADLVKSEAGKIEMVANPDGKWFIMPYSDIAPIKAEQARIDAWMDSALQPRLGPH